MSRVAIITWHKMENYGSALQAYALMKSVEKLVNEVEIIDYRREAMNRYITNILSNIKLVEKIKRKYIDSTRWKRFCKFHDEYFLLSEKVVSSRQLKSIGEKYDAYICGSDQIWSPNRLDSTMLLDFVKNGAKKVSYAPSTVIDTYDSEQKELLRKYIPQFNSLSLREKKGVETIKNITGVEGTVVLDPTFLLASEEWDNIAIDPSISDKYILCYLLGNNQQHREWIKKMKNEYGYKIITLAFSEQDLDFGDIVDVEAGPREFLGYIKKAAIICTDSFHGVALSINYRRNFFVFERFNKRDPICQNTRIQELINIFGLEERLIKSYKDLDDIYDIDYKKSEKMLNERIELSKKFLNYSLTM